MTLLSLDYIYIYIIYYIIYMYIVGSVLYMYICVFFMELGTFLSYIDTDDEKCQKTR